MSIHRALIPSFALVHAAGYNDKLLNVIFPNLKLRCLQIKA